MNTLVSVTSQNSTHFVEWISLAASQLRLKHGSQARIVIVIDNTTWHNKLTGDTTPPKRSWRKSILQRSLINRKISFNLACTKAELLELAFNNLPAKKYLTDVAAAEYQVEIVRLPIKHSILNPIVLCWSQLKGYVRRNNAAFRLDDIIKSSQEVTDQFVAAQFVALNSLPLNSSHTQFVASQFVAHSIRRHSIRRIYCM